jgi:hypothetical protein
MELCFRHWARCNVMSTDRVNYKVFRWAFRNAVNKKENWCFRIMTKFRECNLELYTDLENILHKNVITQLDFKSCLKHFSSLKS